MSNADEWVRAHTIGHNRTAKAAEREKLAADVEAFIAAGGEIDVRDATGNRMVDGRALSVFPSYGRDKRSRKGGKKSHRTMAAAKSKG